MRKRRIRRDERRSESLERKDRSGREYIWHIRNAENISDPKDKANIVNGANCFRYGFLSSILSCNFLDIKKTKLVN